MTREEINKLADRVEGLTGPDREVDCRVQLVKNPTATIMTHGRGWKGEHSAKYTFAVDLIDDWESFALFIDAPRYTASLDAAMSLVPEGMHPSVSKNVRSDIWRAWVVTTTYDKFRKPIYNHKDATEAATHALALTAAALRARAEVLP
jgi:hypothetical protein